MLRVGKSKLKALAAAATLAAPAISMAQNGTWTFNGSETWSINSNWFMGTIATGNGMAFLPASSLVADAPIDIHLNSNRTLQRVDFSGAFTGNQAYNITGGSNLTVFTGGTINADSGTHRISSPVTSGAGNFIVKSGAGTVILGGSNNFGGSLLTVNGGVLVLAAPNSDNGIGGLGTANGAVIELGLAGAGSLNLSPGDMGSKVIALGSDSGANGTLRNVNGNNSMAGTWFVLNSGSVNIVSGSLSVNGSIFDSNDNQLNGFEKAGTGTFTANTIDISGVLANTAGQFNLVGTGSNSVGTTNITGGLLNQTNGTFNVVNQFNIAGGGYALAAPGRVVGNQTLSGGLYNLNGGTVSGVVTVNGGTFTANGGKVNTLAVAGGTARMLVQGAPNTTAGRFTVNEITVTGGGKFDITNNTFIVDYTGGVSPVAQVRQLLKNGFNGGLWDGANGIVSANAAADAFVNGFEAIGYLDNADLGSGSVPAESVVVKYAYYGDTDLTGAIDLDDFNQFLFGFENNAPVRTNPQIWLNGDFDYSDLVDLDDFNLFLATFTANLGSLGALGSAIEGAGLSPDVEQTMLAMVAAVPEPASLAGLAVGASMLMLRRRRTI